MRNTTLQNKKCFITGAASGIGRALAETAAVEGAELFLTDINRTRLDVVVAGIRERGGQVTLARALDIADFTAVRELAREIHAAAGSMDVVMNVAGISIWGAVENLAHEHWRRCVDINLMGPIHVIECFIPEMIRAGRGGNLVNVSSAAGLFGLPWHAAYSASKFGLRGVSEVLRYDLKRHGIAVSVACPGGVDTGLVSTLEIVGIDSADPQLAKLKEGFRKHAKSPAQAARAILKGMKAGQYMVFTSFDIRFGYWWQRKFAPPFNWVMQKINDRFHAVMKTVQSASGNAYGPAK